MVYVQYESIGSMDAVFELIWKYSQRFSYCTYTVVVAFNITRTPKFEFYIVEIIKKEESSSRQPNEKVVEIFLEHLSLPVHYVLQNE